MSRKTRNELQNLPLFLREKKNLYIYFISLFYFLSYLPRYCACPLHAVSPLLMMRSHCATHPSPSSSPLSHLPE